MARSEYSRLRSIAEKRLSRLSDAGFVSSGVHFPKVADLGSEREKAQALKAVQQFLNQGSKLGEIRKSGEVISTVRGRPEVFTESQLKVEKQRARRRERERERREVLKELTNKERGLIKGATRLGFSIRTSDIPAFIEYMKYRFSQVIESQYYQMLNYTEDFMEIAQAKRHSVESVQSDFERFLRDRENRRIDFDSSKDWGYTEEETQNMWNRFIKTLRKD